MNKPRTANRGVLIVVVILALVGAQLACDTFPSQAPAAPEQEEPASVPRPTNTPAPEVEAAPFQGGACEEGTQRIDMGESYTMHVNAGTYPDTCEVYCLWVPDGSRLEIGISNFDVDLDIYVDIDLSVLSYSDHGQWESNAFGTGDEDVSISSPGGRYYIQVCSYEGVASDFTLWSDFTP